jgi:hypothetical protein
MAIQGHVSAELEGVMKLLPERSLPGDMQLSLSTLTKWSCQDSSLQSTIPFTMIAPLLDVLHSCRTDQAYQMPRSLSMRLGSALGQPVVVDILASLGGCPVCSAGTILKFLEFLAKNVAFSLPEDVYARVMAKSGGVWDRMFGTSHTAISTGGMHLADSTPTSEQLYQQMQSDRANGILYPSKPHVADRKKYSLDKPNDGAGDLKAQESIGAEHVCGKRFSRKAGSTGLWCG